MDVFLATVGLLLLSPLLAAAGICVALVLGRPVILRQERPGRRGVSFRILKFRTMSDGSGPDAERLGRFGRFLRSTSFDELPELWNVLAGEMSLVGPRPLLVEYLPLYTEQQAKRHDVRPGITGWAQVNGRNDVSWERRFELDVWYVENCSLLLDLRILLATLQGVFLRRGISAVGHVTMPRFTGSGISR